MLERVQQLADCHRSTQLSITPTLCSDMIIRHRNNLLGLCVTTPHQHYIIRQRMSIREASKTQNDGIRMHVLLIVAAQDLRKLQWIHLLARIRSGYRHTPTRFQPNRRESAGITEVTLVCRTFMSVASPSELRTFSLWSNCTTINPTTHAYPSDRRNACMFEEYGCLS